MARKRKINLQEVDLLKLMSVVLPVLVALSGFAYMQYNEWLEPDFSNGQYFTTAWIEYGLNQNTLNIEYVPDAQGAVLPAIGEAVKRVHDKADINSKIDGKPLLVRGWVRYKSDLIELVRFSLTSKEMSILKYGTFDERMALLKTAGDRWELLYNHTKVMIERDGKVIYLNTSEVLKPSEEILSDYLSYHSEEVGYA